ncbi:hypothetical protein FPV33_23775 [Klebsiella aerogenes]|nr:hypothetical protein F0333_19720 [Klebsiella aerogenes]MBE0179162.1 hypothetical protein [Klebsiella aerogenes]MBK1473944.1 hypothetical protein [Klebsiella aerogenes]OLR13025.1 hypothetical protein BK800_23770 [Klebsiella aerogenes]OQR42534.1 hypothetical protein BW261_25245 [Klebsiella aerogenes]
MKNGGSPNCRRFSILPWSAADADQGELFFPLFALPLPSALPQTYCYQILITMMSALSVII